MAVGYTDLFNSKALHNLPKLIIFGSKVKHLATLLSGRWSEPVSFLEFSWCSQNDKFSHFISFLFSFQLWRHLGRQI
jgi:hypothetical protein